jgi:hypothetical protein
VSVHAPDPVCQSTDATGRGHLETTSIPVVYHSLAGGCLCKSISFTDPDGLPIELSAWVRAFNESDIDRSLLRPVEQGIKGAIAGDAPDRG